jgi:predicted GIY-YIG superfamily endonuclease
MKPPTKTAKTKDKPISTTYIPYPQATYGRLGRMLAKHNIKIIPLPPKKISNYLPPVKDAVGLRTPGIYSIPCECGKVYIGQTGSSIQIRIKEHESVVSIVTIRGSNPVGNEIFRTVQTGPRAHPASYTMGIVSHPGDKATGSVVLTTQPHLAPILKKEYSYTSIPPLGIRGLFRVNFTFTFTFTFTGRYTFQSLDTF